MRKNALGLEIKSLYMTPLSLVLFDYPMKHTLTKGGQSNYEITLTVPTADMESYKLKALEQFQKEMKEPGFRPGQVPLDMVEKKINPAYLEMGTLEEIVHAGTKELLEEHKDIKFIGSIYDLNRNEKDDTTLITFKLDIYPEVKIKNDDWKKKKLDALETTASDQEVEDTLMNLRRQYADYKEADTIEEWHVSKIKFHALDDAGTHVDHGSIFIGKEETDEFPELKERFFGKKKGDHVELDYNEKKLPPILLSRNKDVKPVKLDCEVVDIRSVTLPELTPENIQKFFGNEEVKTQDQLKEKIKVLIEQQKNEMQLMQSIDKFLQDSTGSFEVIIPKTLIDEEMKTRLKSLEERMGGEEGLKKYFEKVGEEDRMKMMTDIQAAAKQSLEKFFLLKEIVEKLGITDIEWQKPLDVETKLYEKLSK